MDVLPSGLLKSTILSIPKDYKIISSSDNYRGISLFNCICKLYDHHGSHGTGKSPGI